MKLDELCTYPCRGVLHTPRNNPRRRFGSKTGQVLGISLLGRVKSGGFLGASLLGKCETRQIFHVPV